MHSFTYNIYVYGTASVVLFLLWLLYVLFSGTWNPARLFEGADGRPSSSKLQWFLWTIVAIFTYTAVYASRCSRGNFGAIEEVPSSLLVAMGLSTVTMTAAKGITAAYAASGRVLKSAVSTGATGPGAIFLDDYNFPDLSKIQMLAWTFIAIGVYLYSMIHEINDSTLPKLLDISPALMVLMGLGQGGYLGKKLTTTSVPRLSGLSTGSGRGGSELTVSGSSFGDAQNGSLITIDGNPISVQPASWNDTQIKFNVPLTQSNGSPWSKGQRISLGVIVGGQESTNTLPFTIN